MSRIGYSSSLLASRALGLAKFRERLFDLAVGKVAFLVFLHLSSEEALITMSFFWILDI